MTTKCNNNRTYRCEDKYNHGYTCNVVQKSFPPNYCHWDWLSCHWPDDFVNLNLDICPNSSVFSSDFSECITKKSLSDENDDIICVSNIDRLLWDLWDFIETCETLLDLWDFCVDFCVDFRVWLVRLSWNLWKFCEKLEI